MIIFQDGQFEQAVRREIKKIDGELTRHDLEEIRGIVLCTTNENTIRAISVPWVGDSSAFSMVFPKLRFDISSSENGKWLSDLALFGHIVSLRIIHTHIENLDLLKNFSKLRELYIIENHFNDWSPIQDLIYLKMLSIVDSNLSDLEFLGNLAENQELERERYREKNKDKNINNVVFDSYLMGIDNIHLEKCGINDITPLGKFDNLSELNLKKNEIEDITPLWDTSIYYLRLAHNKIKDISSLLDRSYYISLRYNQIEDISVFKNKEFSYLGRLFLEGNPIKDFSPVERFDLPLPMRDY